MTTSKKIKKEENQPCKDFLGRELAIDDAVVFNPPRYKGIILGKVINFTPKGLRVQYTHQGRIEDTAIIGKNVIKIDGPEATLYLLKRQKEL